MGGPIGLWAAAEWRRRWPALIGIAVLVAIAVGVPAGLILGQMAWTALATPANVLVRLDLEPGAVAGVALLTVVLLVTAAIWPSRHAARLGLGDLRYE